MIQESINQKFDTLGVLLLLDCPDGLEFGIDNISWKIGDKFKGVKMIPLGTHIIAYSLQSQNHFFKISKFIFFNHQKRIHVYRWNDQVSQFLQLRGEQADGYREGVRQYHFDSHLGPYPNSNFAFWSQTTKYISAKVLDKLDPIDKLQQFQQQYSNKAKNVDSQINLEGLSLDQEDQEEIIQNEDDQQCLDAEEAKPKENLGKFKPLADTIYYSQIPRAIVLILQKITEISLDKTPILEKIITKQWKGQQDNFLGQLQYSFVHFIIGESEQSLEQWKKILDLLVNAESAFLRVQPSKKDIDLEKLSLDFIPVFYDQLNQFPVDFFRDSLSKGNFICNLLKRLHEYAKGQQYSPKLRRRIEKLLQLVSKKFEFTIDSGDQDEEDKPIVVNESQEYF